MNHTWYIGKVCPYCKTAFTEYDDLVICSKCEMPHHKSCWIENQGCTTFGCTGTIQAINDNCRSMMQTDDYLDLEIELYDKDKKENDGGTK
ncbi:hypothetical protein KTH81_14575 [Lachnospiraceae bacterium ASD3451]|uniref:RING finger protein n=1 Tax=Diplocloster agilis TaxID=2850323 RepID=UPI001D5F0808|nr:RING finger protein [Diplocloster agilis]MBU9745049.1 hypothetical protein [Diplocloster agilis]